MMYKPEPAISRDEAFHQLEALCQLGTPALIVNKVLRTVCVGLALPALPAGCLLGFAHGAFMLVTFGLYALLWALVWLPMLGVILATSWLWWKVPILWPVWFLLALVFLLAGYLVVLLGPSDPGGEDRMAKAALVESWPYSYFVMFESEVPTPPESGPWQT